ncbi:hypothetical protein Rm378p077 [Rhodothermus phage RM378]|uniref:hypothetical protein n=1 Tax=Rhodothermus phage RM378 TaxID=148943 RepID=UPI000018F652|nr:hypothetical protein Rm378p077 [Rhodothermus phage RM378]
MSTVKIPLAVNIYDPKGDEWEFIYSNYAVEVVGSEYLVPVVTLKTGSVNYFRFNVLLTYSQTGSFPLYLNFLNKNTNQINVVYRNISYSYISSSNVNWYPTSISGLLGWWQAYHPSRVKDYIIDRTENQSHLVKIERYTYNDQWLNPTTTFVSHESNRIKMMLPMNDLIDNHGNNWVSEPRNSYVGYVSQSQKFLSKEYTFFYVFSVVEKNPYVTVSGEPLIPGAAYPALSTSYYSIIPKGGEYLAGLHIFRSKTYSSVNDKMNTASLMILFTTYPVISSSTFAPEYKGDNENAFSNTQYRIHPAIAAIGEKDLKSHYVPGIRIVYHTESTMNPGVQLYELYLGYKNTTSLYELEVTSSDIARFDVPTIVGYRIKQSGSVISYSVTLNNEPPVWYVITASIPSIDLSDPIFTDHRNEAGIIIGSLYGYLYDYQLGDVGNLSAIYRWGSKGIYFYEALLYTRSLDDAEYQQVNEHLVKKYRFGL